MAALGIIIFNSEQFWYLEEILCAWVSEISYLPSSVACCLSDFFASSTSVSLVAYIQSFIFRFFKNQHLPNLTGLFFILSFLNKSSLYF